MSTHTVIRVGACLVFSTAAGAGLGALAAASMGVPDVFMLIPLTVGAVVGLLLGPFVRMGVQGANLGAAFGWILAASALVAVVSGGAGNPFVSLFATVSVYIATAFFCGFVLPPEEPGPGVCRECGYNLEGLISSVCPECGTRSPTVVPKQHRLSRSIGASIAGAVMLAAIGTAGVGAWLKRIPASPEALVEQLGETDIQRQSEIARRLYELNARDQLIGALGSESARVREAAVNTLGRFKDPALAPAIETVLDDPSWRVQWRALQALEKCDSDRAVAAARRLAEGPMAPRLHETVDEVLRGAGLPPVAR